MSEDVDEEGENCCGEDWRRSYPGEGGKRNLTSTSTSKASCERILVD